MVINEQKNKLKILMINDSDEIGGVRSFIINLQKLLAKSGHDVTVIFLSQNDYHREYDKVFIKHGCKNKVQWFISENLIDFFLYKKLRKVIIEKKPDVIHLHNIDKSTKTILLACRGFKKIKSIHDIGIICPLKSLIIKDSGYKICQNKNKFNCYKSGCLKLRTCLLDNFLFNTDIMVKRAINKFICCSESLYKAAKAKKYKKLFLLPHFYESAFAPPIKNSADILFAGRIVPEKGLLYLLEAFKISLEKNKELKLSVVGGGSYINEIFLLVKNLGIGKSVKFFGEITNDEIGEFYNECLAVVIPSIGFEASSMVAYEAMAHGRPIVAFDNSGLSELVEDGENGFLVNKFDVSGLASKIDLLSSDIGLANEIGRKGRILLEKKYAPRKYLHDLFSLYES